MLFLLNKDLATNKVLILYSILLFYLQFEEFFFQSGWTQLYPIFFQSGLNKIIWHSEYWIATRVVDMWVRSRNTIKYGCEK